MDTHQEIRMAVGKKNWKSVKLPEIYVLIALPFIFVKNFISQQLLLSRAFFFRWTSVLKD